jgi:hypothetical protein
MSGAPIAYDEVSTIAKRKKKECKKSGAQFGSFLKYFA